MLALRACGIRTALAFSMLIAVVSPVGAVHAQNDPVSGPDAVVEAPVDEVLPGDLVIETTDPSIDTSSPRYRAALEELRDEQRVRQALGRRHLGTRVSASTSGDIVVTFVRSTPADVQAVVEAAIADWNTSLTTSSAGPVHVSFDWVDLSQSLPGTLGFAGPTSFVRRADGIYYPVALANTLDRRDHAPGSVEIEVTISSAFHDEPEGCSGTCWFVDATNSNVPGNRLDLYATMLHEVGHGLGFLGSAERRNGVNRLQSPPDKFDTFVRYGGSRLVDLPNNGLYLTSGELFIDIGGGLLHELYAPSQFFNGSSYSHFDEVSYRNGAAGSLMSPALGAGEVERVIDAPTLGVLVQTGWQTDVPLLRPSITQVTEQSGSFDVSWSVDLKENAVPPTSFDVRAIRTSDEESSAVVVTSGSERTARLTGLTNNVEYRIEVTPLGNAASPGADVLTLRLTPPPGAPTLVVVAGSGYDRTIRWQLDDDGGSPVTRYDAQMSKNGGPFVPLGSSTTAQIATGELTNDVYQFRVQAVNGNGTGPSGYSLPTGFTDNAVRPLPLDGEISRLYQVSLDRLPDPGGMAHYLDQRASGRSLVSIADDFLGSPEFVSTHGELGDRAFVEQLYRNIFGRDGDPAGVDFWTAELNGRRSRASVVIEFAQSSEFVELTGTAPVQTRTEGAIYRLYLAYFLRPADPGGASYWTQQALAGSSLTTISDAFARSPEFIDRYGELDNGEFVGLVYANVLGRTPDPGGESFWLDRMTAGLSQGDVMLAFSESLEFKVRTGTTP